MSAAPRYASVDALRGLTVAAMLLVNNPGDWGHVYAPLLHAPWHGCTPTDLVFPFFLFIVGVSIALGVVPRLNASVRTGVDVSADRRRLMGAVATRALRIVAIGLLLQLLAWWWLDLAHYRPYGVLQRIGLCFAAAGALALYTRARMQWIVLAGLLLGYWALLLAGGSLSPGQDIGSRIDTALLGAWLYRFDDGSGLGYDPEGLLSTLPAIATTLLGVRAGQWLRQGRLRTLAIAALSALILAWVWSAWLPFNKTLWTSSYALWTGGWAMLALLLCHLCVDRWHWPAIGRSFGVNAITAYAGAAVVVYALLATGLWGWLYQRGFAGWMTPHVGPYLPSLAFALAYVGIWWVIVAWMDRRGWHLKV
jgi:predicted acyltransferase